MDTNQPGHRVLHITRPLFLSPLALRWTCSLLPGSKVNGRISSASQAPMTRQVDCRDDETAPLDGRGIDWILAAAVKLCNTPIVAAMAFCRPLALAGQAVSPFLDQRSAPGNPEPFPPCLKGSCIDMSLFDSCSLGPYMNGPPASSSLSPRLCCCSLGRPSPNPGTDSLRMAQGPSLVCLCLLHLFLPVLRRRYSS